ncbi:disulfide bond formation protein DsbA [Bailinhaonella thermotolerans]|uniref:Disulfide bond formation protein DsbA n=1 Tax=Bailinhaonella thermotolerans TaxID=1070861 RepID=A0A3A4AFP8_9ACTN|nr:disulfide bond formation protein DsbA [Bailinhaonella thermotolerans]RJL24830.1 disulfide bond formation protein DsbA [Bailinhaonella thermotolerans]
MSAERRWTADFWFDPSCPYTWLVSRWLVEAAGARGAEVRWHVMSLSVLNEGRDDDPEGDPEGYLWVPVRICAAVRERYGQEALGRFYTALWTVGRSGDWLGDLEGSLEHAGLPRELAAAGMSEEYDGVVRASHAEAMALLPGSGTPVTAVTGPDGTRAAFFGPVVSRVPRGEEAGRLWDAAVAMASVPGFHEFRGQPHAEPVFEEG